MQNKESSIWNQFHAQKNSVNDVNGNTIKYSEKSCEIVWYLIGIQTFQLPKKNEVYKRSSGNQKEKKQKKR